MYQYVSMEQCVVYVDAHAMPILGAQTCKHGMCMLTYDVYVHIHEIMACMHEIHPCMHGTNGKYAWHSCMHAWFKWQACLAQQCACMAISFALPKCPYMMQQSALHVCAIAFCHGTYAWPHKLFGLAHKT